MSDWNPIDVPSLALAFIGDAVWEVYVRNHVLQQGVRRPADLHRQSTRYVTAKAQATLVEKLWGLLAEDEQTVVRRGRNAKSGTVRKHADVLDYRHSTGFEALIGYLYGKRAQERLDEVCRLALQILDEEEGPLT